MSVNSWYHAFPASDPLDVMAGFRFEIRKKVIIDKLFVRCCELAGIPATPRQARKWTNGQGLALRYRNAASK